MKYPHLLFAEDPAFPDEVAVSASLVPTFEPPQPQEEFEVLEEVEPESTALSLGNNYVFMFIVDRSGSMSGARMETCKAALKLFLRSLPVGSKFSIISFGSNYTFMTINGKQVIDYNNKTSEEAIRQVERFSADCGGTEILSPFKAAQVTPIEGYNHYNEYVRSFIYGNGKTKMQKPKEFVNKRIFLLTDGQVGNSQAVINQADFLS